MLVWPDFGYIYWPEKILGSVHWVTADSSSSQTAPDCIAENPESSVICAAYAKTVL